MATQGSHGARPHWAVELSACCVTVWINNSDTRRKRSAIFHGIPTPDIVILRSQLDQKWGALHSAKLSDFSQPALRLPPGLLGDQKKTLLRPGSSQNAQFPGNA